MKLNYKPYLFVFWGLVEIAAITACLVGYTSVFKVFPWYTGDSDMTILIIISIGILILVAFAQIALSSSMKISRENQMTPIIQLFAILFSFLLVELLGYREQVIGFVMVINISISIFLIYKVIKTTNKDFRSQFQ
jgi:hypothetical protein